MIKEDNTIIYDHKSTKSTYTIFLFKNKLIGFGFIVNHRYIFEYCKDKPNPSPSKKHCYLLVKIFILVQGKIEEIIQPGQDYFGFFINKSYTGILYEKIRFVKLFSMLKTCIRFKYLF